MSANLSQHLWVTSFSLAQVDVELPSSWVQVGPWRGVSKHSSTQVISVYLSAPINSHRSKDGGDSLLSTGLPLPASL